MNGDNENTEKNSGFLAGMIIGGAIGAAVAYFLGSDDKEKALKSIKEKGRLLLDNIGELKENFVDETQEIKEAVEEKAEEIVEEVKEIPAIISHNKKGFGKSFFKKGNALVKK